MSTEETVRNSQMLLQRMTKEPEAVLEALDPAERDRVMEDLHVLAELASEVQDEADLLYVADEMHCLVKEPSALAALLPPLDRGAKAASEQPKTSRGIRDDYDKAAYRKSLYVKEQAVQLRNRVVEVREKLEGALRDRTQNESKSGVRTAKEAQDHGRLRR